MVACADLVPKPFVHFSNLPLVVCFILRDCFVFSVVLDEELFLTGLLPVESLLLQGLLWTYSFFTDTAVGYLFATCGHGETVFEGRSHILKLLLLYLLQSHLFRRWVCIYFAAFSE